LTNLPKIDLKIVIPLPDSLANQSAFILSLASVISWYPVPQQPGSCLRDP